MRSKNYIRRKRKGRKLNILQNITLPRSQYNGKSLIQIKKERKLVDENA